MEQAGSFGRAAAQYERSRPPYPAEALSGSAALIGPDGTYSVGDKT